MALDMSSPPALAPMTLEESEPVLISDNWWQRQTVRLEYHLLLNATMMEQLCRKQFPELEPERRL